MKRKVMIGVALAAAFMLGAGAGYCYRYIQHPTVIETQTEVSTEAQTDASVTGAQTQEENATTSASEITAETTPSEIETTSKSETESGTESGRPQDTTGEAVTAETEIGTLTFGVLPKSADDFIIADEADQFFEHSVFIGDSVMMGFRNYVMGQEPGFLGGPEFLVSGSFSVRMALNEISKDTIHPIYQGEQRYIWDSISLMGAEKVFLFFGLNDIGMEGVDGTSENYIEVIKRIREVNPQTELYVISTTNMLAGSEKGSLNNGNIALLNDKMRAYCKTANVGFIDIASFLVEEDGSLRPELCSDAYVHQTAAAYEIWTKVLRGYASGGTYTVEVSEESETPESTEESGETETTDEESAEPVSEAVTEAEATKAESAN